MPAEIERYRGREQSYIKHLFLNEYLEAAAFKLLQSRSKSRIFNFVDAFAGPWRVSDDDEFSDSSFSQAIRTLEAVRRALAAIGRTGLRIRYRFCERNNSAAAKLSKFAAERNEFDIKVFRGSFEDNIDEIGSACRDGFTFTFIDPTGWNVESERVFAFLGRLNGEFLFNFMAEEVNRHAGWKGVAGSFGRFLADPAWYGKFSELPDDWSNETKILFLLKLKMKEMGTATYLPDMTILKPVENRAKMRLVLGTHSVLGVEVFRKVQQKVEKEATSARHRIAIERTGQPFLFPSNQLAEFEAKRDGVGCPEYLDRAADLLHSAVVDRPGIQFRPLSGEVMEKVPVRTTDLNRIAMSFRKAGRLGFDLPPRKRAPTPTTPIWPA